MNFIQLILVAIRGLAVVTNNPAIGGGSSVHLKQASDLLGMLGELLERGDEAHNDLVEFTKVIEAMAKEGRPPDPREWDALKARSDAAHSVLQEALAEAEAEEAAEALPEPTPEPEPEPGPEGEGRGTEPETPHGEEAPEGGEIR